MPDDTGKFSETLRVAIDSRLIDLHTALPAKVVSFNPAKQTVNLELIVKRIKQTDVVESFPVLVDVAVCFAQTKEFAITFPIKEGDTGQVIFNERQIDNWEINGDILPPDDARKHSLSDAVFFPNLTNQKNNIPNFNNTDLEIRTISGPTRIKIAPTGEVIIDCVEHIINSENTTINATTKLTLNSPETEFSNASGTVKHGTTTIGNDHRHSQGNDSNNDSQVNVSTPIP